MKKIKTYNITETSYRYGDESSTETLMFVSEDLMNQYFEKLYLEHKNNDYHNEIRKSNNNFGFTDGFKWNYEVAKSDSEITIFESIDEVK